MSSAFIKKRLRISKEFLPTKKCQKTSVFYEFLVYVINDGSKDKTLELAQSAGADRIVKHKVNRGLGAAIRSGMTAAKHDGAHIVVKFDADLQHNPDNIWDLIQPIINDEADTVYGHRFRKISYKMPFVRKKQ